METTQKAVMTSARGVPVALKGVSIQARLLDLLAIVDVTQTYRNDGKSDIEAVYTFPLPPEATLLDLELTLGERRLRGKVIKRQKAVEQYEQAIEAGHSALMLELSSDGIYTLNLGHLRAGEEAIVRFRYGLIGRWNDKEHEFRLPTTLAPRYGNPALAGLAPHQEPKHSLDVIYPFSLQVEAFGRLHQASIRCRSHAIATQHLEDRAVIMLGTPAVLDRDLVLNFRVEGDIPGFACYAPDEKSYSAWASFRPQFAASPGAAMASSLRLVIDCSGSMSGDSIDQAKTAMLNIMDRLIPEDRFNITAFGTHHKTLFNEEVDANLVNIMIARSWISRLEADMGDTEIAAAVDAACSIPASHSSHDLLLVTDGEVWDDSQIAKAAKKQNWRIFAVGVGSAPAEAVLRKLTKATGGTVEMVTPGDDMSFRIVRHFERLREPHADGVFRWPTTVKWPRRAPSIHCFTGDTVHAYAVLERVPDGEVQLICTQSQNEFVLSTQMMAAPAEIANDLPRLVAAQRIKNTRPQNAVNLALRYQLISPYTNYLVVLERDDAEAGDGMPELQVVPQMLAAGWGGMSRVNSSQAGRGVMARIVPSYCMDADDASQACLSVKINNCTPSVTDIFDMPPYLRRSSDELVSPSRKAPARSGQYTPNDFLHAFQRMCRKEVSPFSIECIYPEDLRGNAPVELLHIIDAQVAAGEDERWLWVIVAWTLLTTTLVRKQTSGPLRALLSAAITASPVQSEATRQLAELILDATEDDWGIWDEDAPTSDNTGGFFGIPKFLRSLVGR